MKSTCLILKSTLLLILAILFYQCKNYSALTVPEQPVTEQFVPEQFVGHWSWIETTPKENINSTFFRKSYCPPVFLKDNGTFARVCDPNRPYTFHDTDVWEIRDGKFIITDYKKTHEMIIEKITDESLILLEEHNGINYTHSLSR